MYRIVTNPEDGNRITRVTYEQYEQDNPNSAVVAELPEGDYNDYKYVAGEYVYDPLTEEPAPEEPPQTGGTVEERLTAVETDVDTIITGLEALANG